MTAGPGGSRARRIGGLVAGLLIVGFLAASVLNGWSRVSAYDWNMDVAELAAGAALVALFMLMNGIGYVASLERLSRRRLPRGRLLDAWARSVLARYVPGNVLMVAGRVVLGREAGVSGRVSLAASVYEQAMIVGLSGCAAAGLLVFGSDLGQGAWIWVVAVVPFGLVVLHPRLFAPLSGWALRKLKRSPLDDFLSAREVLGFAGWYALTLAVLGVGVWWVVRALVGPTTGGPLFVGAGFLLSFVVSMLAFIFPSGIGVREGVLALVLSRDLPAEVAIAAAAFVRLALTLVEVGFTGLVVATQRPARRAGTGGIVSGATSED
jgi:glycosyltransferase 2 family protein